MKRSAIYLLGVVGICIVAGYHDWLVRGVASTPKSDGRLVKTPGGVSLDGFAKKASGWAIGVAAEVVRRLHDAAGTTLELWFTDRYPQGGLALTAYLTINILSAFGGLRVWYRSRSGA